MINVVLLGAGNVGTQLFRALQQVENISLVQWYNRSLAALEEGKEVVEITTNLNQIVDADLYLLAISDSALPEISQALEGKHGLVAHTAGSIHLKALEKHKDHGVFYPLQTFSKQKQIDFSQIPLCLEANNDSNLILLKAVATALGGPIHFIDSFQRKALHIAAVFVNNFVNHFYAIGEQICEKHQMPFSILEPLIAETAEKIKFFSPKEAQTGPALRRDENVLKDHLNQLNKTTQKELYALISAAIQKHG